MKIGILTFHNADNYGAVLQCYALQEKLKELYPNDEVYVIDYKNPLITNFYIPKIKIIKPWSLLTYYKKQKNRKVFKIFRDKFLNIGTDNLYKYDVIYYGSDQIWNCNLTNNDLKYLGNDYQGKKIAYAASDGGGLICNRETIFLLNSFSHISCREKSLYDKLRESKLNTSIKIVCDPVFLLSKKQWLQVAEIPKEENYVLTYKIRQNLNFDSEAEKIGQRLGKKVIQLVYVKSLRKIFYRGQQFVECITPEQFIGYFAKADFVLTTSFHGMAFSIIFNKPFFVLKIDNASERITDLLSTLHIEDRYGTEYKENNSVIQGFDEYVRNSELYLKESI